MWRDQLYWLLCVCFKEKVHGHSKVMNVDYRPAVPQVRKYHIDTCIIHLQVQTHGMLVDVRQDCIHFLCSAHGVGLCKGVCVFYL